MIALKIPVHLLYPERTVSQVPLALHEIEMNTRLSDIK